jgi:hypothetical protein
MDQNDILQDIWDMLGMRGIIAVLAVIGVVVFLRGRRRKEPTLLETVSDRIEEQQAVLQTISDRLSANSSIIDSIRDRVGAAPSMSDRLSEVAAPLKSAVDLARGGLSQAPSEAWNTIRHTVSQG